MSVFTKEELDSFNPNMGFASKSAPATKRKGRGGFLSSLISEGGAIGAGVQGAALGSFAGPIGTIVGGAIGAGVGGFGGRLAENKIRDDEFRVGDAAKEGAVSAVFGGSPIRAIKGVTAASKAIGEGLGKTGAKEAAEKAIVQPGILSKLTGSVKGKLGSSTERLESRSSGIGVGEKVGGEQLTPQESSRLLQNAIDEGMPFGHPDTKAKFLTSKLDEIGKEMDTNLTKANRSITDKERLALANGFADRFESNVTLKNDPAALREYHQLQTGMSEIDDFKGVVKAKRDIQSRINHNRNSATPDPIKEVVFDNAQKTLNEMVGGVNPELKELNRRYGDLSKVNEGVLNASKKLSDISEAGSGSFFGKILAGDSAQSAKSTIGRAGMATNPVDKEVADAFALGDVPGQGAKGFASRIFASQGVPTEGGDPTQEAGSEIAAEPTQELSTDTAMPEASTNPYDPENAQASIEKILAQGGDQKDIAAYLSNVKLLRDLGATKKTESEFTKPSAQQHGLAKTGVDSLNQLAQMIQNDPKILSKNATPGQGLPIVGSLVSNAAGASGYHALADSILSSLIHLQTGATATKEEVTAARGQLPQPGDPPEVRQQKLQTLMQDFQPFLGSQGSGTTLEDLIAQAGG